MFRRILLWFCGMLVFSFAAYFLTSYWGDARRSLHNEMFRRVVNYQFREMRQAYETGGSAALRALLTQLDSDFPGAVHHLVDRNGRDLATGEDRSAVLATAKVRPSWFGPPRPRLAFARPSQDGRYYFLVELESRPDPWRDLAAYGWIVVVLLLLCYVLAWTLVRPIRQLHRALVEFGDGNFSSRSRLRRNDELGALSQAFDGMADRISTLVMAERRLLQDISHELRSPLTRLRLAVELARSLPSPTPASFNRIEREIDRLSKLIDELLEVARAEGDPGARSVSNFSLTELLTRIVHDCELEASAKDCQINLQVSRNEQVTGDHELLRRAIENVLRNAIRHTAPGSTIEVSEMPDGGHVRVLVRDYGPGVPEEDLKRIFQPFYRVGADRSRDSGGVGLGLSIAERAIRVHHGALRAENSDPGLRVEIRLPRSSQPVN